MITTELVTKGDRRLRWQGNRIREAIGEINQPRRQEKEEADRKIELRSKNAGEKPLPGNCNNRGIKADQVQPNHWRITPAPSEHRSFDHHLRSLSHG